MSGPGDDELVCVCHEVTCGTIRQLAAQYRSFEAIVEKSMICQTCQGCESEIRTILAQTLAARQETA